MSANTWSVDRSQEVDLIVWNDLSVSAFPGLPDRIIVEAKNWDAKVDSTETAWFDWKMRRGNATVGILVAANGVTGNAARREDALAVTYAANEAGRQILLIKLDEIATLDSTEAFYDLLRRKLSALTAIADPFTFGLP